MRILVGLILSVIVSIQVNAFDYLPISDYMFNQFNDFGSVNQEVPKKIKKLKKNRFLKRHIYKWKRKFTKKTKTIIRSKFKKKFKNKRNRLVDTDLNSL